MGKGKYFYKVRGFGRAYNPLDYYREAGINVGQKPHNQAKIESSQTTPVEKPPAIQCESRSVSLGVIKQHSICEYFAPLTGVSLDENHICQGECAFGKYQGRRKEQG